MTAFILAIIVVLIAAGALFAIEFTAAARGNPTISEGAQRFTAMLDKQVYGLIILLLGITIGWFVCHFADVVQ